jgi:hypothetical protein
VGLDELRTERLVLRALALADETVLLARWKDVIRRPPTKGD